MAFDFSLLFSSICYYALASAACYIGITIPLASAVAAVQEAKIWNHPRLPSLSVYGHVKVFWFNVLWMAYCLVGSTAVALKWILTLGTSDLQADSYRLVEKPAALTCLKWFVGDVRVVGAGNLPGAVQPPAPVYVANHASQIDTAAVYAFGRRFKWIAKSSVLFLPGVGQLMLLAGHVMIDRRKGRNAKSVTSLFDKSDAAVQSGVPMFFFPQGTRRIVQKRKFKDGAFIVAEMNRTVLVPITIHVPESNPWNRWYPVSLLWTRQRPAVTVTIHEPVEAGRSSDEREATKKRCAEIIYGSLPPVYGSEEEHGPMRDPKNDEKKE